MAITCGTTGSLTVCGGVGQELEFPAFFSFKLFFPLLGVDGPGVAGVFTASCNRQDQLHSALECSVCEEIQCIVGRGSKVKAVL